jgi:SAM-dependent methyltransferase
MSIFKDYSNYYDLLYSDKNYKEEVEYIDQLIQENFPGAKTILNLGCGTGKHDILLSKKGYSITAIDFSDTMIDIAKEKSNIDGIQFHVGDVRNFESNKKFDVVISLFHVMSYQTKNSDLIQTFQTAKKHLKVGGVFIFDCWYGPGVLADPPINKTKVVENDQMKINRITTPKMHEDKNCVDVNFEIAITNKISFENYLISELHTMRYLFIPEIELIGNLCKLKFHKFSKWLSTEKPLRGDWYIVNVFLNEQ